MRITLRLIVSLVVVVTLVVALSTFIQVRQEKVQLTEELGRRSGILAESLQETVEPLVGKGPSKKLQRIVDKFGNREGSNQLGSIHRLVAITNFGRDGRNIAGHWNRVGYACVNVLDLRDFTSDRQRIFKR